MCVFGIHCLSDTHEPYNVLTHNIIFRLDRIKKDSQNEDYVLLAMATPVEKEIKKLIEFLLLF